MLAYGIKFGKMYQKNGIIIVQSDEECKKSANNL